MESIIKITKYIRLRCLCMCHYLINVILPMFVYFSLGIGTKQAELPLTELNQMKVSIDIVYSAGIGISINIGYWYCYWVLVLLLQ